MRFPNLRFSIKTVFIGLMESCGSENQSGIGTMSINELSRFEYIDAFGVCVFTAEDIRPSVFPLTRQMFYAQVINSIKS